MAYVYRKTKSRAGLAAEALARPVAESVSQEPAAAPGADLEPASPGQGPRRKRGPGKNNKHGSGCGTNNGYWAHKRADEDACTRCLQAHREYNDAREAAQSEKRAA